ncbi:protein Skeletor, isoforms B/C isoform X1 [Fopius arisanus]|uniref:Protein Skeletor, isoforms B/C isoform X1 n=1 Tax=Fopius arisanus TaxID=64838 RepID=A0A0C9QY12_9HYME|nr:PREDICTED: protein Skeletor, isoforms B/C isoform X1 [Fopius arisanus]
MASPSSSTSRYYLVHVPLLLLLVAQACSGEYYGKLIGKLSELHHDVSGEVYAVDARTLFIKDLTYDGEGPSAYFYAGNSKGPITNGFKIRDERGMSGPLHRYKKQGITLTLPEGKTLNNIKWFAIWCDDYSVNFGDVRIPRGFDYPKPQKLSPLDGVHLVSSEPVVVVDAQTLLVPSFSYDGEAPDAKFWVGAGPHPSSQGVRVPDENGKMSPLRRYDRKTIVLTLPGDLTVHQLGHFGVWCEAFTVDFGHIQIPQALNIPPSLKMLGVSPQSKLNCEVLEDNLAFEVRWAVAGDSIVVQLVGKLDGGQYMSFGLSANMDRSVMVGGDVVVAWVDKQTLQGYAVDYFLDAKSQCSGGRGNCPDTRIQENTNSVRLLNAAMVNGYSIVTYQRPLGASDELDRQIRTNGSQAIIWAIGPLNERNEVSYHSHYLKTDRFIEFGRPPSWNCPMPEMDQSHTPHEDIPNKGSNKQELVVTTRRPSRPPATPAPAATTDAWEIPPIQCNEPDDGVFYAQLGPTGGKHGYPAITGHVGWGISWYINGLLIPEINVIRGKTYTFVVEGGDDPETPAVYHPFYITDDPIGGYAHKTPEEKSQVKIFAGVRRQRGTVVPTGYGRLCRWVHDENSPEADEYTSFGAFQRTLSLKCNPGEPGIIQWTPDKNTPDAVYYQCFTHRYLGWKINVLDSCDFQGSASENHEIYARPEATGEQSGDLDGASSIGIASKVTPAPDFYQAHQNYGTLRPPHNYHHYHNYHTAMSPQKLIHSPQPPQPPQPPQLTRPSLYPRDTYERLQLSHLDAPRPHYVISHHHNNHPKEVQRHQVLPLMRHHIEHATASSLIPQHVSGYYREIQSPQGWQTPVSDQDVQQSQVAQIHASNSQSNSLADQRPFSYVNMKYQLPHHNPSYIYSRTPVSKQTQVMIVRRPGKRPIPQAIPPELPRFMERKKAVYRPLKTPQTTKLTKIDKQRAKIESKISSEIDSGSVKPARNTGFDPGSIVIEGGFKPIIRSVDREDQVVRGQDYWTYQWGEPKTSGDEKQETFEPVYLGSVGNDVNLGKFQPDKVKQRLDEIDDMEMAADGLDAYYLPPPNGGLTTKRIDDRLTGTLIAFDGKRVKDSSLTRSIPTRVDDQPRNPTGKLSDVLTRTPQFGKFRGELPPLIPRDGRAVELHTTKLKAKRTRRSSNGDLISQNATHHDHSTLASTGQIIITNIEYVVLTVILYFVI